MTGVIYKRMHVRLNKSIYLSISLEENLFENRSIYIYIYIHTHFEKRFHTEKYIDRYILLFCCTCARVQFSHVIVQLVKNLRSTIIFSSSAPLFHFNKEHAVHKGSYSHDLRWEINLACFTH